MNAVLGTVGLVVSLAGALAGIVQYAWGIRRRSGPAIRAAGGFVILVAVGALLSTFAMQRALLTHDFSIANVAENSSRETPLLYQITGMWSSLAGSILLWALILSLYLALVAYRSRKREPDRSLAWTMLVGLVVAAYFFALMLHSANPFITLA
ncbi:MAG: heme lyase CcmF/NrfE family subunit, partial [Actinomycetota bacterium]|nr:heme lyase CcmF/NrfE family subunit [Actinomycetota bacterium]